MSPTPALAANPPHGILRPVMQDIQQCTRISQQDIALHRSSDRCNALHCEKHTLDLGAMHCIFALHIAVKYRVHCNSVQFSRVQVKYSFNCTALHYSAVHSTVPTLELYLGILTLYCTSVLYPGFVPWYCGECIGVPTLVLAPISQAVSLAPDDMTSHPIHYRYRVVLQHTSSGWDRAMWVSEIHNSFSPEFLYHFAALISELLLYVFFQRKYQDYILNSLRCAVCIYLHF